MDSEWIEHHGKGYPDLPMDTDVMVKFADGAVGRWSVEALNVCWRWDDPGPGVDDITHYRVVKSDE